MKNKLIFLLCLVILCSCQSLKLSKLTSNLIDLYIEQNPKEQIENIELHIWERSELIGVTMLNKSGEMRPCGNGKDWWGTINRDTYNVFIYGMSSELFFSAQGIAPKKDSCTYMDFWFWEPTEWIIRINQSNQTVSVSKTSPFYDENVLNTDDVKELVKSYLKWD